MNAASEFKSVAGAAAPYDVERIRADFPILSQTVHGKKLVYFDSAASAQKPRAVIDAIVHAYESEYANVHRGVHYMSQRATDAMEAAREKVRTFLNAADTSEIIFVRELIDSAPAAVRSCIERSLATWLAGMDRTKEAA